MKRKARSKAKPARAKRTVKAAPKKRKASQPPKGVPLETLVVTTAEALGIPVETAWRGGVIFNFGLIVRNAALVDGFKLPDEAEPAPVYRA